MINFFVLKIKSFFFLLVYSYKCLFLILFVSKKKTFYLQHKSVFLILFLLAFLQRKKKLFFIDDEAVVDNDQQLLPDSESEEDKITDELHDLVDNTSE